MPQISNSEDVYQHHVEDSDDDWLLGLVAFAVVEEQRIEWMQHYENTNETSPTADDITKWYQQQPDGVLLRAKGTAENALAAFCDEAIDEAVQVEREKTLESAILSEIRLLRRFWPHFSANVLSGVISAILFAAILVIVALFLINDISPVTILKDGISQHTEGN